MQNTQLYLPPFNANIPASPGFLATRATASKKFDSTAINRSAEGRTQLEVHTAGRNGGAASGVGKSGANGLHSHSLHPRTLRVQTLPPFSTSQDVFFWSTIVKHQLRFQAGVTDCFDFSRCASRRNLFLFFHREFLTLVNEETSRSNPSLPDTVCYLCTKHKKKEHTNRVEMLVSKSGEIASLTHQTLPHQSEKLPKSTTTDLLAKDTPIKRLVAQTWELESAHRTT